MIARVVINGLEALAFVPYELREVVKAFPGRRCDLTRRCWVVDRSFVDSLANVLRAAGATVCVTRGNGQPWSSGGSAAGYRDKPRANWADALFSAVGAERVDQVHRALTRVLHPDVGGTEELQKALNGARDRARAVGGSHD